MSVSVGIVRRRTGLKAMIRSRCTLEWFGEWFRDYASMESRQLSTRTCRFSPCSRSSNRSLASSPPANPVS
jgi:hypothetical protein